MSDEFEDPRQARQARIRAAWALGVIALVAVIIGCAFLIFGRGGSPQGTSTDPIAEPSQPVVVTSASSKPAPAGPSGQTGRTTPTGSGSGSPPPAQQGQVNGDTGDFIGALNTYRAAHGKAPVTGSVTRAAQKCAANNGDSSACPQSYFWEPVDKANGKQVLTKILAMNDGPSFLLGSRLKAIAVGWSNKGGGWQCAVIG